MNDIARRKFNMFVTVRGFGTENISDFPASSRGGRDFVTLSEIIATLEASGAKQSAGVGRQSVNRKAIVRAEIQKQLAAYNRTAKAITTEGESIRELFKMPKANSDQILLATARAFINNAVTRKGAFIDYGMLENFISNLENSIAEFEEIQSAKGNAKTNQVETTVSIENTVREGMNVVTRLKAVVENRYTDNPAKLAAWRSACKVEKADKKKTEPPKPVQPS
jgi:hypothetical protein